MLKGGLTESAMSPAVDMAAKQQLVRYVLVGLISNAILYGMYIELTSLGMGPKFAMSLLYGVGVAQTFVFNKQWSFRFNGAAAPALMRYATAYALGYGFNLAALILLVDRIGLSHQWVQGVMVFVIAIVFFLAQRYWVFAQAKKNNLV